jgi:hypothetical protein
MTVANKNYYINVNTETALNVGDSSILSSEPVFPASSLNIIDG